MTTCKHYLDVSARTLLAPLMPRRLRRLQEPQASPDGSTELQKSSPTCKPSLMAKHGRVIVRIASELYDRLSQHLRQDSSVEQMALAGMAHYRAGNDTYLFLHALFLPDDEDHARRSAAVVEPHPDFKRSAYEACRNAGLIPADIHTHCHPGRPSFSCTDDRYGEEDAQYVKRHFDGTSGLAMLVWGNDLGGFDGRIWDNQADVWRGIDEVQILGVDGRILRAEDRGWLQPEDPSRDRQLRIPGYRHDYTTRQHVVVGGLGGNGARMIEELTCLGIGKDGSVTLIDHDAVEVSNLARIPYATEDDIGEPKAEVAARYLERRMPGTVVRAFTCGVHDPQCQDQLAAATLLLGCGDSEGLRAHLNKVAVQCLSVYIDAGCDIQCIEDDEGEAKLVAGGQVRTVLPGSNACLVCCRAYDPSEAALDLMTHEQEEARRAAGYVRGMDDEPAPSVSILNALCASYMSQAFLAVGHPEQFDVSHYLRFDLLTGDTITATSERLPGCPLCGRHGQLGMGLPRTDSLDVDEEPAALVEAAVPADHAHVVSAEGSDDASGDPASDAGFLDDAEEVDPSISPFDTE